VITEQTSMVRRLSTHSVVRFVVVGGLSLLTNTAALYALHGVLGMWLPLAAALAFAISFVVNFGLNRMWTFESDGALAGHLWRYLALVLANLALNAALVTGLSAVGVPYLLSQVIVTAMLSAANYVVSQRWIFT
jgi:putative flippase GtrA